MKHDLIQQTAAPVLIFRVLEGLAAWILFNETAGLQPTEAWPIHVLFLIYFSGNGLLFLRYRTGSCPTGLVLTDLGLNLGTMMCVAAYTGGVVSPLVLVCLSKIAAYGFVFSPVTGVLAIALTTIIFGGLAVEHELNRVDREAIGTSIHMPRHEVSAAFHLSVLGGILIGATWLFYRVAEKENLVGVEARRAKKAAERERAAATVTAALLAVSEAVSRLTKLDEILNKVVDVAPRILGVDYCGIFLWTDDSGTYRGAAVSGVDPARARHLTNVRLTPEDVPDLEWVRRLGHCAVLGPRDAALLGVPDAPTLLTAPLLSGGRFYGVLQFARRDGHAGFDQGDLRIADGIAGQTAVALERARLVEESRRLVRAVESTEEAVLITDRARRIVFANPACLRMLGHTWEELAGRDSLSLGNMPDEWVKDVERAVVEGNWGGEVTVPRTDGSSFPAALHVSVIRSEDNRIEGSVTVMEDISAQKRLQEQMARAERLAAAGELAAGVAHEVNNALAGILGQAELARGAADAETLRTALDTVESQGHHIADILQELLGFARPEPPERQPVDLRDLVRDTLALMAHDLGRNRIRNETRFAIDLPPVLADAKQIQQVLVNLFTNALQAMQSRGEGVLGVSIQPSNGFVNLDVQDTGTGIAPEALPRVFDPFFSTKTKGTGLGLSVSYATVRAHGGDLTVRSTLNHGTTFTLQLPAVAEVEGQVPRTVLLVDDDPLVAETLSEMLAREGLRVQRAATGAEALAALASDTFDAIFLDVRLPDISGPEVYARLAAERPGLARRVVFVTCGLWRTDNRGLRETLPPQPTLSKPCTAAQIREVLRLLGDSRAAA